MEIIETDVVIAGAGGSGLAAAAAAAERGARVIVLEKRKAVGGNATFAEGIFASESPAQKRSAVEIRNDDMFKMAMDFANWELNGALLRAFVNKSGDTVRWLEEKGVKFDVLSFSPKQMHRVFHNPPRGGPEILKALIETCNRYGVQIIPGVSVTKILLDRKRKVTGITATGLGLNLRINAKSVIIATGGFAGNKKLLQKYCKFDTKNSI